MNLNDFKTPEDLIYWVWKNTKAISIEEDDEFIPPEKIFEEKRCNCLDIAILMYLYCESKDIECTLADIDMVWKGKDGYNNNGHVVALVKDPHNYGNWSVMQVSGLDDNEKLNSPVFNGNSDKVETLKMFMSVFIPGLENWVTSKDFFKNKNGVIDHYQYFMLEKYHLKQIEEWYMRKDYKEKQKKIWNLMEKDKWVKMTEPVSEANNSLSYSKYTKKYKNFDEFCKVFKDPEDVIKWFRGVKFYWPDNNSEGPFRWPDQLVKEGCGICFDNGIMMHYFCKYHKIENIILELWTFSPFEYNNKLMWVRNGHITTIFQNKNDRCWYEFDPKDERHEFSRGIGSRIRGPYKSQHEAIEKTVEKFGEFYKFLMKKFKNEDIIESEVFYHVWTKDNLKDLDNIYNKKINRDEWSNLFIAPTYKIDQSKYLDKEATIKNLDTVQFLKLYAKMYGYKVLNFLNIFKESTEVINENITKHMKDQKDELMNSTKTKILPVDVSKFHKKDVRVIAFNPHVGKAAISTVSKVGKNVFRSIKDEKKDINFLNFFDVIGLYIQHGSSIFALDIAAVDENQTLTNDLDLFPVVSCDDGIVYETIDRVKLLRLSDNLDEAGICIVIQHSKFTYTLYAHLKADSILVKKGDKVKRGQKIAEVGLTGNTSIAHLHFETTDGMFGEPHRNFLPYKSTDIGGYLHALSKDKFKEKFHEKMKMNEGGTLPSAFFITDLG